MQSRDHNTTCVLRHKVVEASSDPTQDDPRTESRGEGVSTVWSFGASHTCQKVAQLELAGPSC